MRLYGMYYVCKKYLHVVEDMKVDNRNVSGVGTVRSISDWKARSAVLNELAKIIPLRDSVRKFYETIPVVYRDQDKFEITGNVANAYIQARTELVIALKTIINTYETINPNSIDDELTIGFDIKLPKFHNIGEFSKCLEDLDFVFKHCPYLKKDDSDIKYGSVDVGSTWLTFLIIGTSASILLSNLGKIVDVAIKIKSHFTTVRMQEEALKSVKLKNEVADEVIQAFKEANKMLTQQSLDELKNELGELNDGEEEDKVRRSLEKLGFWMDKGMQIYSTIDSPDEIKNLFPEQEEVKFLSDDILKLIEMKKESK